MNDVSCSCESLASLGCLNCRQLLQHAFGLEIQDQFGEFEQPVLLNVIPITGIVQIDDLDTFSLPAFTRNQRERIASCLPSDVIAAGAVDVSLNVFENGHKSWGFHVHLVLSRPLSTPELRVLKAAYPKDSAKSVFKPVVQKLIAQGELRSAAQYALKSFFTKRSSYIAQPKSDRNPYRDSCDQALSVKEDAVLQAAFRKFKVYDPMILIGLKRKRTSDSTEVRLMRTRKN